MALATFVAGAKLAAAHLNPDVATATDVRATKLPGGVMLLTARVTITIATANTPVSTVLNFPTAFSSIPRLATGVFGADPRVATASQSALSTSQVTISANRPSSTGDVSVDVIAIGTWA